MLTREFLLFSDLFHCANLNLLHLHSPLMGFIPCRELCFNRNVCRIILIMAYPHLDLIPLFRRSWQSFHLPSIFTPYQDFRFTWKRPGHTWEANRQRWNFHQQSPSCPVSSGLSGPTDNHCRSYIESSIWKYFMGPERPYRTFMQRPEPFLCRWISWASECSAWSSFRPHGKRIQALILRSRRKFQRRWYTSTQRCETLSLERQFCRWARCVCGIAVSSLRHLEDCLQSQSF